MAPLNIYVKFEVIYELRHILMGNLGASLDIDMKIEYFPTLGIWYEVLYSLKLWINEYHCFSTRTTLVLNSPWRLICHYAKKPNNTKTKFLFLFYDFNLFGIFRQITTQLFLFYIQDRRWKSDLKDENNVTISTLT